MGGLIATCLIPKHQTPQHTQAQAHLDPFPASEWINGFWLAFSASVLGVSACDFL